MGPRLLDQQLGLPGEGNARLISVRRHTSLDQALPSTSQDSGSGNADVTTVSDLYEIPTPDYSRPSSPGALSIREDTTSDPETLRTAGNAGNARHQTEETENENMLYREPFPAPRPLFESRMALSRNRPGRHPVGRPNRRSASSGSAAMRLGVTRASGRPVRAFRNIDSIRSLYPRPADSYGNRVPVLSSQSFIQPTRRVPPILRRRSSPERARPVLDPELSRSRSVVPLGHMYPLPNHVLLMHYMWAFQEVAARNEAVRRAHVSLPLPGEPPPPYMPTLPPYEGERAPSYRSHVSSLTDISARNGFT